MYYGDYENIIPAMSKSGIRFVIHKVVHQQQGRNWLPRCW